ncbi:hypothetical protein FisN_22Hh209 [Fistulifera solaris]|uniref:Uncharacterized protein n=1 Tax=Fistulifera solaris TaxID=1519565 RepID=A0A1Z5JQ86_FISSO|nr:hypothetical protein FisN_22Hh209 [Fistulifera solaris]|eukprot:GAX15941.1 hypothetical protein FisN_22Hh209 [Fistulifera solaris]
MFTQESHGANVGRSMKGDILQGRGPEDGFSRDGSREDSTGMKRKYTDRDPESPGHLDVDVDTPLAKKERNYFTDMDTDSPSSYPKHVLVPSERSLEPKHYMPHTTHLGDDQRLDQITFPTNDAPQGVQVLTPDSVGRGRPYEPQPYPPRHYQQFHDVYRTPSYTPDMDYGRSYPGHHAQGPSGHPAADGFPRSRRWACDYCNVATFLSYEEACAHEDVCSRRHHDSSYYAEPFRHRPAHPAYGGQPAPQGSGLGALYHASQEVVTPPTPYHQQPPNRWGAHHAPPLPVLPHEQNYYRHGYYDMREEHPHYPPSDPYYHAHMQPSYPHPQPPPQDYYQKRLLLALPSDRDSLSDRQCFVRSEMVEIFAATQKDVSARHSKGAQKLVLGQVGIRCVHCSHLRPRDRAERSVCYPKSICRIYQTVADMQRFHFENCREIPDHVRQLYKKLKTTRPRGVGSPQSYWVSSAKSLGLVDTGDGICFEADAENQVKDEEQQQQQEQPQQPQELAEQQPQASREDEKPDEPQSSDLSLEEVNEPPRDEVVVKEPTEEPVEELVQDEAASCQPTPQEEQVLELQSSEMSLGEN